MSAGAAASFHVEDGLRPLRAPLLGGEVMPRHSRRSTAVASLIVCTTVLLIAASASWVRDAVVSPLLFGLLAARDDYNACGRPRLDVELGGSVVHCGDTVTKLLSRKSGRDELALARGSWEDLGKI